MIENNPLANSLFTRANSKSPYSKGGHALGGGEASVPADDIRARREAMAEAAEARMKALADFQG